MLLPFKSEKQTINKNQLSLSVLTISVMSLHWHLRHKGQNCPKCPKYDKCDRWHNHTSVVRQNFTLLEVSNASNFLSMPWRYNLILIKLEKIIFLIVTLLSPFSFFFTFYRNSWHFEKYVWFIAKRTLLVVDHTCTVNIKLSCSQLA